MSRARPTDSLMFCATRHQLCLVRVPPALILFCVFLCVRIFVCRMDSDSDLMYVTASEGEEEFPSPPRRRRRRRHRRPRGCRAGLRVQRQRLAAARAAAVTTLPAADATVPAAAHAELRAENKRLKERLDETTQKCSELRERVWTLLDEARTRNRQPPPSAPPRRSQPSDSRPPPYPRRPSHEPEARRRESRRQQEARRHESRRRRDNHHREPRPTAPTPPPPPRSAKKESVLDRLVALHPLEEMDFWSPCFSSCFFFFVCVWLTLDYIKDLRLKIWYACIYVWW